MTTESRKWVVTVLKSGGKYVAFDYKRRPAYFLTEEFEEAMMFAGVDEHDNIWDISNDAARNLGTKDVEAVDLDAIITVEVA